MNKKNPFDARLDCASVRIEGPGTSTLEHLPDMFVGDMTLSGHIGAGECRSTANYAVTYPFPGNAVTVTPVENIPFKAPTGGKCFTRNSRSNQIVNGSVSSGTTLRTGKIRKILFCCVEENVCTHFNNIFSNNNNTISPKYININD